MNPNAGYSGQIGVAAPGAGLRKGGNKKATSKKKQKALEAEPTTEAESTTEAEPTTEAEAMTDSMTPLPDPNTNEQAADSEGEAEDLSEEEQRESDAVAESLIFSITEKNKGMSRTHAGDVFLNTGLSIYFSEPDLFF